MSSIIKFYYKISPYSMRTVSQSQKWLMAGSKKVGQHLTPTRCLPKRVLSVCYLSSLYEPNSHPTSVTTTMCHNYIALSICYVYIYVCGINKYILRRQYNVHHFNPNDSELYSPYNCADIIIILL